MRTDYDNATLTSSIAASFGDDHFELADGTGLAARHRVHTACLAGHNHDVVAIGISTMTTAPDRRNVATDAIKSNDMRTADLANGENPDDSTSQTLSDNAERGTAAGDADRVAGRRSFHEGRRPHDTRDLEGEDLA